MGCRVVIEVPEGVSEPARKRAHQAAVLALWQEAELSTGEAAEELGLSHHEFLDLLAAKGIPAESGPLDLEAIAQARRKLAERRA